MMSDRFVGNRPDRIRLLECSIIAKWVELMERAEKLEEVGELAHAARVREVVIDCMRDMVIMLKG